MQAMILAAGFGTRLLPYTRLRPKPLFPILTTPLLLLTIQRLKRQGFSSIIVNCHYLGEQIVKLLQPIEGVIVQQEEYILGTGGGLRRALPLMKDEPLLITNGDIYHTIPFEEIYAHHVRSCCAVTLGVHDYPRFNVLCLDEGRITGFDGTPGNLNSIAFTGLHVIDPQLLSTITDGKKSCILDCYRYYLKEGGHIDPFSCDDYYWTDMGTVPDYLQLHEGLVTGAVPCVEELEEKKMRSSFHAKNCGGGFSVKDWAVIDPAAAIGEDVSIARSVVWEDAVINEGASVADAIVTGSEEEI